MTAPGPGDPAQHTIPNSNAPHTVARFVFRGDAPIPAGVPIKHLANGFSPNARRRLPAVPPTQN